MPSDIRNWLDEIGLGKYLGIFAENEIDLDALLLLSEADLQNLGLPLGPRRKLQRAIEEIRTADKTTTVSQTDEINPEGERRQVTVLFADLCNFTHLSTMLDAEEIHDVLNKYFETVDSIVTDHGGKIDKHIGDSVMAVFGAPTARTDDPIRAVRAACAIHARLEELDTGSDRKLIAHIGIASGPVVASRTGSYAYSEYTVTGETVNLASRLDSLAGPGETLISEAVHHASDGLIAGDPLGGVRVEGFPAPVDCWRVTGILPADAQRLRVPFVGRATELRLFNTLLSEAIESRLGHTILVRGEPGIGKTRLVDEFVGLSLNSGFSVHRGQVLDFGVGRGQDAMAALVRSLLSVNERAEGDQRRAVADAIDGSSITRKDAVFLNDLLGLPQMTEQQNQYDAMDVESRNEGKRAVITGLAESSVAAGPIIIVIEDVHWADEFILSCLVRLASSIRDIAALLVMTSRLEGPSEKLRWSAEFSRTPKTTMELQPLRADETLALARSIVRVETDRISSIAARSEGNPLFLEQLIRNAVEGQEENLPGTLQGLVLARMDRLPARDREALVAASVLGQGFKLEELRFLLGVADYEATRLIEQKLVRFQGSGLLFDHALIRDAVYASLLKRRRRELHARAAEYFAGIEPVLHAEHLELADDPGTADAFLRAAEYEANAYRTEFALMLLRNALATARNPKSRFLAICRTGELELDSGAPVQAAETFRKAAELAESAAEQCRVNIGLAAALRLVDKQPEALSILDRTETLAMQEELPGYAGQICYLRGNLYFTLGDMQRCRRQHQMSYDFAKKANDRETEARALGGLADANYADGKLLTAHEGFKSCVALAEELGLGRVAVANRSMVAITILVQGDVDSALATALEAIAAARAVGQQRAEMVAHHAAHQSCWLLGKYDISIEHNGQALSLARKLGSPLFEAEALLFIGESRAAKGDMETAYENSRRAVSMCREHGMAYIGPIALGRQAATSGDLKESEECLLEGEALLQAGSISHNHIWFYRDAIDVALAWHLWDKAARYSDALEAYTAREPMRFTDFVIARGKALAAFGRGAVNAALIARIRELHEIAQSRYIPLAERLAAADGQTRSIDA